MSNIKLYRIDWDYKAELVVEVDHEVMTEEKLHEINNFWTSPESRISDAGTVLNAVLKMLTSRCIDLMIESGWGDSFLVDKFDWDKKYGVEGWPQMDGSEGIKIISAEPPEFSYDDMTIEELEVQP
ncbi:DUF2528 family protein [Oceanobacter mangrovi]|uniref:DUF2528 family protein n=1 Tax=Oceanobacter mangrovi TaxID=2862510 RepID=UPI001C8E3C55|nr:DUF2528 family protein [Oceanobacter mangrovi]